MNEWLRQVVSRRIVGVVLEKHHLMELVNEGWKVMIWAGHDKGLVEIKVNNLPENVECELHDVSYSDRYVEIRHLSVPVKVPIGGSEHDSA